jgi:hypothetical protein
MIHNLKLYEGGELKENEFLLKIRERDNAGFMSKLTQKNEVPVKFEKWDNCYNYSYRKENDAPIYVIEDDYANGWNVVDWRAGQSQTWIIVRHPQGFTLEITMDNFIQKVLPHLSGNAITGEWRRSRSFNTIENNI